MTTEETVLERMVARNDQQLDQLELLAELAGRLGLLADKLLDLTARLDKEECLMIH